MTSIEFHHIGLACKDIKSFKEALRNLFQISHETEIVDDPEQNAKVCIVEILNGLKLELIQGKPVENLVKKSITYYHLCFRVDNIDETIEYLSQKGCLLIQKPKPATLFNGQRVAFLYTPIGLIELFEGKNADCSVK